jgi:hypothetical protein
MDHFESIIATLLEAENYWVRRSFKVNVTKEEKRQVKKHSIPRPEIDLLALHFSRNEVIAFEAKSFLDSPGVRLADLQKEHDVQEGMYKLFTSRGYREVVLARLKQDLIDQGKLMKEFLEKNNFVFWSPEDIKQRVTALGEAKRGYENDPAIITAKILMR